MDLDIQFLFYEPCLCRLFLYRLQL